MNWLLNAKGEPQQVAYIHENVIGLYNSIGGVDKYQNEPLVSNDIELLRYVELTEDTLLKIKGFEKKTEFVAHGINEDIEYFELDGFSICKDVSGKWFLYNIHSSYMERFKYIHQLQNLYFALVGKELEIDLK